MADTSQKVHQQEQEQKQKQQEMDIPLLKRWIKFMQSNPGLEKSLRLLQAFLQIGAAIEIGVDDELAGRLWRARGDVSVARRYFRFFNFIDCFSRVYVLLGSGPSTGMVTRTIDSMKWTCLGMYFLLEDFTILHAMKLYTPTWTKDILLHANRFWFYGILLSIMGGLWILLSPLLSGTVPETAETKNESNGETEKPQSKSSSSNETGKMETGTNTQSKTAAWSVSPQARRLVVDSCDLLIPGSFLGWIPVSSLAIGVTTVVSTLVAMVDIWANVQGRGGNL